MSSSSCLKREFSGPVFRVEFWSWSITKEGNMKLKAKHLPALTPGQGLGLQGQAPLGLLPALLCAHFSICASRVLNKAATVCFLWLLHWAALQIINSALGLWGLSVNCAFGVWCFLGVQMKRLYFSLRFIFFLTLGNYYLYCYKNFFFFFVKFSSLALSALGNRWSVIIHFPIGCSFRVDLEILDNVKH